MQEIRVFYRLVGCSTSGTLCSTYLHATLHDLFCVVTHNTVNIEVNRFLWREISGQSFQAGAASNEPVKYSDFLHLPHGLDGYFDYDQALKVAQAQDKPLFIDFTGHGCVNCREMEQSVSEFDFTHQVQCL